MVLACAIAMIPAVGVLSSGQPIALRFAWQVPYGSFFIEIDPLSAFFLLPILGLTALSAIYAIGYWSRGEGAHSPGAAWFFYNLLAAGMVLVVVARNGVLFLVAWEVMSLASFFLVTLDSENKEARSAGWTYLVATHLGTAFLFVLFVILGQEAGSLDFDRFGAGGAGGVSSATLLFLLALVGFGTKAGIMPFHVWLPEAHPAAPSPVSALMSGVMIKTGIYGIVRTLTWLGAPPPAWGWLLILLGLTSGVLGVVFAFAQHDLKRLLAYHSVENIGIILLGLGVGVLGRALGHPTLAVIGFAGGLLHVLNHAIFKGLLFLGAGSVAHATSTRDMDHLGGLLKRMPWTGGTFLIAAAAISGLPPLNGFLSEFLIYRGAFEGFLTLPATSGLALLIVIGALALIGGLAAACFAKAYGIVFLGEPRTDHAEHAHESPASMRWPMAILAAACFAIGLGAPRVVSILHAVLPSLAGIADASAVSPILNGNGALYGIVLAAAILIVFALLLLSIRGLLLSRRSVEQAGTWDCGYARPTARMQYTSSSFAQPLTRIFQWVLQTKTDLSAPTGLFPERASLATHTPDVFRHRLFAPVFTAVGSAFVGIRRLQEGRVQVYILYVVATLLILLLWKL